jgi:thiol-disulfide isomerase/thioredoxin
MKIWPVLFLLTGVAFGQSGFTGCDAAPALSVQLEKAAAAAPSPGLPFEPRMAGLRDLMRRYPADPFVNRLYLAHFAGYNLLPLFDRQLALYEALYKENSADPARRYLYALSRAKRDPKGSAAELEKVLQETPQAPWPRLTLAYIYGHIKPVDEAKAAARLNEFAGLCPDTLDREGLQRFASDGSAELKSKTVARLRKQLPGRTDWLAMEAWPVLWQLEFQTTPASGHDEIRRRIRSDLTALRALKSDTEDRRLSTVHQGYILVDDTEGRRSSLAELMRAAPESAAAAEATIEDWDAQNPIPDRSGPFADWIAFQRKEWDSAKEWAERWPNYGPAWSPLYTALMIDGLPADQIAALGRQLVAFGERNPDYTLGFTDPPTMSIAERLASTGAELAAVPALLDRAVAEAKERQQSDMASTVRPFDTEQIGMNFQIELWLAARVRGMLLARTGKSDAAQAELKTMLKEIDAAPSDSLAYWRGIVAAADAAIVGKFNQIARDALARMDSALAAGGNAGGTPAQKRDRARHEADYWETRAKLAIAEGRGIDGAAYYLRAMSATPRDFNPAGRSRLAFLAHREWTLAGGTEDGWQAYNPDATSNSLPQWITVGRKMPDFNLEDSAGRPVRLADLSGRKVFINVWATWCGPCQGELPWVQRLYDALKDRKDIAVLTFNIDENPGLIGSYMREHNLTFPVILAEDYVNSTMKVETIPRNWIIDAQGVLRFERQAGFDDIFVKDTIEAIGRIEGR